MRRTQGFTLIELLVVIGIIVILAAILFPVFAKAKAKSLQTSCIANLRQLTAAMKMYAGDYDDQYPYALYADTVRSAWADVMFGYVQNDGIFQCPAESDFVMDRSTGVNVAQGRFIRAYEGFAGVGYSYGLNSMEPNLSLSPQVTTGGPGGQKQTEVEDPAGTILMADTGYYANYETPYVIWLGAVNAGDYRLDYLKYEVEVFRHGSPGRFNVGFCDGHAKNIDIRSTIVPVENVNMWTIARYN